MRKFLIELLDDYDNLVDMTLFSVWHFLYIALIVGGCIGMAFWLNKQDERAKNKALRFIAYALVVTYIFDFFMHPFVYGELNIDKLPFHICTALCPVVAFTQFNKKFAKITEPVSVLAIVAPLMYITYPGSALGGVAPWCYKVVQTFLYHGLLLAWGFLTVATGRTAYKWKNIWKALVGIVIVALWASLGNALYSHDGAHYDWFFLTGSTFPFVPTLLMPFLVIAAVFGMCAIVYAIYYGVLHIAEKRAAELAVSADTQTKDEEAQAE